MPPHSKARGVHTMTRHMSGSKSFLLVSLLIVSVEMNLGPQCMQPRRKPPILAGLNVGLVNARSAVHKAAEIHALIAEHHLDVLHVTETWFQPDTPDTISMDIAPPGFRVLSVPRSNGRHGGELAVIFKEHLKVSTAKLPLSPSSFEMQAINLLVGNINFILLGISRPPSTNTEGTI